MRYDTRLPSGAKLLFGEITALCNKEGYCWAGNAYFARLYGTSERTIINWINSLKAAGHITVELIFVPGKKEVQQRRIWLAEPSEAQIPIEVSPDGEVVKFFSPPGYAVAKTEPVGIKKKPGECDLPTFYAANVDSEEIHTPLNGYEPNSGAEVVKFFSPPMDVAAETATTGEPQPQSDREVVKYTSPPGSGENDSDAEVVKKFSVGGENFFMGVVKNSSGGGEKNFTENITNNNKIATATAPPRGPPPDDVPQPEAAAAAITWERLKDAISSVDRALVFDTDFYTKAVMFINENDLDLGYPAWLYRECENKNPSSFDGLYFRLFFAGNLAEKYRVTRPPVRPARPPPTLACPVCETVHEGGECPVCGLTEPYQHEEYLEFKRCLFRLSPETRAAYTEREDAIYSEYGVLRSMPHIRALKKEFGLP